MKYFLLLLPILFLLSCDLGPTDKTRHPLTQSHSYPDSNKIEDTSNAIDHLTDAQAEEEELYNIYRDLWQKPIDVIQQMGNLEEKTVADIGAGPYGYFTIQIAAQSNVGKVIAMDIDPKAIKFIEDAKKLLPEDIRSRIETRLVEPNDAKLKPGEADIILIVNTATYFDDRVAYFTNLRSGLAPEGKLVVIDFKMRNTPVGPPMSSRIPLGQMERDLATAGYASINSDDRTLEYQYIIIAGN